ncbi:MAG: hypothetical protein GXP62_12940, partial [Oligoflexia bacterium]|nr:hypothetical protein [Oligoflexia bacterium]
DPATGQVGLVGDQPMIVALAGFEPLARAPSLLSWPQAALPFPAWVSTQCPWDQLPIQIALAEPSADAATDLDAIIGDWYSGGFDGAFGSQDAGRLHYISDPESLRDAIISWHVDCGRARMDAIDDLLRRLTVLHDRVPLRAVLIGRGYVPD